MRLMPVFLLVLMLFTMGCSSTPSTHPEDYVGEYVFTPHVEVPQEFADVLILASNQEAVEIRFDRRTGREQTRSESWYLSRNTGQNVVIGSFSSTVERSGSQVKLGLNDDLGQYYLKVR